MQFVRVKFNAWDRQAWTYTNPGPAYDFQPGDRVIVNARGKLQEVEVTGCSDERPADVPPHIELKAIERILPRVPPANDYGAASQ